MPFIIAFVLLSIILNQWIAVSTYRDRRTAARLACSSDKRAVGPLCGALSYEYARTQRAARAALTRMLPHLQANDANLLTDTERACLYRVLSRHESISKTRRYDQAFVLAALSAIERIGDEKAIPVVTRMADKSANAAVRSAAKACLPALRDRIESGQAMRTLLRPSGQVTDTSTLLHPAAGTSETQSELLLRPSTDEDT